MKFIFSAVESVEDEIEEAVSWYANISSELALKFLEDWETTIDYLLLNPYGFELRHLNYRCATLNHFKYVVVYEIIGRVVLVHKLIHAAREPGKRYGTISTQLKKPKQLLEKGKLVAIPTETVYGLAANGFNETAIIKIFEAKNRPFFDPLILHTNSIEKIKKFVKEIPEPAMRLAKKFWPGPLTLILPKKEIVPDLVTSGLPDVAVRIPNHPLTLELLSQLDFPVAAPSANPFGYVSPTSAAHVKKQLGNKVQYVLDGGECEVGIESTIVAFENGKAIVYRLGGLSLEEIEKVIGKVEIRINQSSNPKAPGQLKSHYAPRKPLFIGEPEKLMKKFSGQKTAIISFYKKYPGKNTIALSKKKDLQEAAHNLFSALRKLDESDADIILAENFPDEFLGRAINDRLKRAATDKN